MSFEIGLVFGLILLAIILFTLKSVSFDLVAMIVMSTLMLTGSWGPSLYRCSGHSRGIDQQFTVYCMDPKIKILTGSVLALN